MSVRADPGDWIAVDWGTTTMRAALVDPSGTVRARAPAGPGMGDIARADGGVAAYEVALAAAAAPWLGDGAIDVLVCGMAGARQGWVEAPYRDVPAALDDLLASAVSPAVPDARLRVRIVPGLCVRGERPDVMRGEETQLLGLLCATGERTLRACLPGTHSKWARVEDGRVIDFATHVTGEINALVRAHSVVGLHIRPASGEEARRERAFDHDAFDAAVETARASGGTVLDRLFALRARSLLEGADRARDEATLSGLLIGAEVAREAHEGGPIHLVGGGTLTALYARALRAGGIAAIVHDGGELAVAGLSAMRQSDA